MGTAFYCFPEHSLSGPNIATSPPPPGASALDDLAGGTQASHCYFLHPLGIFYGVFIWFRFCCASENCPFVLPSACDVLSPRNCAQKKKKKITQLLPEAYTSRERPAPNHHTLPGNGGSEDRMSPCSSLLGFGLAKQRQEGHVFTVELRRSLPIWISAPSTCLP